MIRASRLLGLVAGFASAAAALANDIAVDPGQATFDKRNLPLVCMEVGTLGAAVPLDSVIIAEMKGGSDRRLTFADSLYHMHSRLLTAYSPNQESLALPIFRLQPGKYVIRRLEFIGPATGLGYTTLTFGVGSDDHPAWFEVKAGCVNFVGGISVRADWPHVGITVLPGSLSGVSQHSFAAQVFVTNKISRDAKWACDRIPCIAALPSVVSPIRMN